MKTPRGPFAWLFPVSIFVKTGCDHSRSLLQESHMKTIEIKSKNTKRAMSQLFNGGRVIVANEDLVRVFSPKALERTDKNMTWVGGPVALLLDEDVTPYDLKVALEALMDFLLRDLPSEDVWPSMEVFSN